MRAESEVMSTPHDRSQEKILDRKIWRNVIAAKIFNGRGLLILAGLLALLSSRLPLWGMTMHAPQYPNGLNMHVYPGAITGDLSIINVLNHYVGMAELYLEDFPQIAVLPYAIYIIGAILLLAGLWGRKWIASLGVGALGLVAVAGFIDLRRNLYHYGMDLDPMAPLDLEPFVPNMIGWYEVWNFKIHAAFMSGTYLLTLVSIMAVIGLIRLGRQNQAELKQSRVVSLVAFLAAVVMVASSGSVWAADFPASPSMVIVSDTTGLTLNEALQQAEPGTVIQVLGGVHEGPFVVGPRVTLVGQDRPVLQGGGEWDLVTVHGGAHVEGFVIAHETRRIRADFAAVRMYGSGASVSDNDIFVIAAHGIYVDEGGGHFIADNRITGDETLINSDRGNGIYLFHTEGNTVTGNVLRSLRDAIYVSFDQGSYIENNAVTESRYGFHSMYSEATRVMNNYFEANTVGSAFMFSRGMEMTGNRMLYHTETTGYGILLKDGNDNVVADNQLVGNFVGLFAEQSDRNDIQGNWFVGNALAVEMVSSSVQNRLWHNAFKGNQVDTRINAGRQANEWHHPTEGGNYWDRYRGLDLEGSGFGALPHQSADAFGYVTRYHPELRAFLMSPSVLALEWVEQAFPAMRTPRIIDPKPLLRPLDAMPSTPPSVFRDEGNNASVMSALLAGGWAVLLAASGAVMLGAGPAIKRLAIDAFGAVAKRQSTA